MLTEESTLRDAEDLVLRFHEMGIVLWNEDGRLCFDAPEGVMTEDMVETLRRNKAEILAFFEEARQTAQGSAAIQRVGRQGELPLSFAQQRLWFLDQLQERQNNYNMPFALALHGLLDVASLVSAFRALIDRHEILRTTFPAREGHPRQHIHETTGFDMTVIDLGGLDHPGRHALLRLLPAREGGRPFDLAEGPLLRVSLLRSRPSEHLLAVTLHHIVADGWSNAILVRELASLYDAWLHDSPPVLPDLEIQYADYAVWQRSFFETEDFGGQLTYWREALEGAPDVLKLPRLRLPEPGTALRGAVSSLTLDGALTRELRNLGARTDATLFMTLHAVFGLLLSRFSGQSDVLTGTPLGHRAKAETEPLIGFFVNTLALRTRIAEDPTASEHLAHTRRTDLEAFRHAEVPFEKVVEAVRPQRVSSHNPLVQVMFVVETGSSNIPELPGLALYHVEAEAPPVKFDLVLTVNDLGDNLNLSFTFSPDTMDVTLVSQMARHFRQLCRSVIQLPECRVSRLPILTGRERETLLESWHGTGSELPGRTSIDDLFRSWAERSPDSAAVVHRRQTLSYRCLERRAGAVRDALRRQGLGRGSYVPVMMGPEPDMIAATLGILMAGAAYVPLDPDWPGGRLAFLLNDTGAETVLTHGPADIRCGAEIIDMAGLGLADSGTVPARAASTETAYVIYTSGSTGRPKGVSVSHRAVCRLVCQTDYLQVKPSDRFAQAANIAFDAATFEIWGPLLNGASACLVPRVTALDPGTFAILLDRHCITVLFLTTALFNTICRVNHGAFRRLRVLLFGGEAVDAATVSGLLGGQPPALLLHVYGPTENTTFSTWFPVKRVDPTDLTVPIGASIANSAAYVLDGALLPVPAGAPGQLLVGGAGLARGYLNRPALTAAAFIPHPFAQSPGERLYQSGDLVTHLPSDSGVAGPVVFLNRLDQQIKLRGFRIEIGEVEARLLDHAEVSQAVVLAQDESLWAFVTGGSGLGDKRLRAFLRERLPAYMVPTRVFPVPELPLTPNRKIDRQATLRLLAGARTEQSPETTAPARTPLEEKIAAIWRDILGTESFGIHTNFFELGGHSLLATQVISRIRKELEPNLPLRVLFERPTVAGLAKRIARLEGKTEGHRLPPPVRHPERQRAPLSYAQQRLWFLDQMDRGKDAYTVFFALELEGSWCERGLERALNTVIQRHHSLRTVFLVEEGQPWQKVLSHLFRTLPVIDLIPLSEAARERLLEALIGSARGESFDLGQGPLLRTHLIRLKPAFRVLLIAMHHLISDGWSVGVMVRETGDYYRASVRGILPRPDPLPIQYSDYSHWQRAVWNHEALERQRQAWKARLADAPKRLELPSISRSESSGNPFEAAVLVFSLSTTLSDRIRALALREDTTLFVLLQSVFAVLLSRYSGQGQVLVGTPIANRHLAELEPLIGFLVNSLVLRTDLRSDPSFRGLLAKNRDYALGAFADQDLPFDHLVELLAPDRDPYQNPLFRVMFAWQNAPVDPPSFGGGRMRLRDSPSTSAKFDITLAMLEKPGRNSEIQGLFEFRKALFEERMMRRMVHHFRVLLENAIGMPDLPLSRHPVLDAAERHQVLVEWNDRGTPFPSDRSIHEIFAGQARMRADALAVRVRTEREKGTLTTYAGLSRRADRLAACLQGLGVGPDRLVGIFVEHSVDLFAAHVAVLQSGAAYVPLDPQAPANRLALIFRDIELLITNEGSIPRLPRKYPPLLVLERLPAAPLFRDAGNPSTSLAYVMYTSGSTGRPKGVAVTHRNIARLVLETNYLCLHSEDRVIQAANPIFDASTFEIWSPLLQGAALVAIPSALVADAGRMARLLGEERISTMLLITAVFHHLARENAAMFRGMANLFFGGEQADPHLVRKVLEQSRPRRLVHLYGPTESTTLASWHRVTHVPPGAHSVPIGRPISNTGLFVTDAKIQPVAPAVHGQLCIGGEGLARGYAADPGKTAERFIPNPFGAGCGERIYRTGDLVRFRTGGTIDFIGRADHQIKFRGYRIELGEIENVLLDHSGVSQAVVLFLKREVESIVAYLTWDREWTGRRSLSDLKSFLADRLPGYMMPASWVVLARMPLTPTGKIDRAALPAPEIMREQPSAPSGQAAELLAVIFEEVLQQPKVGTRDNFFELGGHSLLAARATARINEALGVRLPLQTLFRFPTVVGLAEHLASAGKDRLPPILPAPRTGTASEFPLSFAQRRLWLLHKLEGASLAYQIPVALELAGRLDAMALAMSLKTLTGRHGSLRTRFAERDGVPIQIVAGEADSELTTVDLGGLSDELREMCSKRLLREGAARPFDLSRGPLLRRYLIRERNEKHVLAIVMHHIVTDGWSMGVLTGELSALYSAFIQGRPSPLREQEIQYVDYAHWQHEVLEGALIDRQLAFWKDTLAGSPACHDLPTDFPRPAVRNDNGASLDFGLGPDLSRELTALARSRGLTVFMVLQTLLAVILARFGNQQDVVFGTPVANRPRKALESVIGFFVNTLVLRHDLSGQPSFAVLFDRVRQRTLEAFDHQEAPFEQVVDLIQPERSLAHSPLFQVLLVWQNLPESSIRLPGLSVGLAEIPQKAAKFDLTFTLEATPQGINGTLTYNASLFRVSSMRLWTVYFTRLAAVMAGDPTRRICSVDLLTAAERQALIRRWDRLAEAEPNPVTALRAFENQAERGADRIALFHEGRSLSYGRLDLEAKRMAHFLSARGVVCETPVAIGAERSADTVIAILAVMKTGAFFVPLDLSWPEQRRARILRDTGARHVLHGGKPELGDREGVRMPDMGDGKAEPAGRAGHALPGGPLTAANLAYVIFTSGTSGGPKGVAVSHAALANYLCGILKMFRPCPGTSFALVSSPAADLGFTALFPALASGGTLHLIPAEKVRDARSFIDHFGLIPIDILKIVPSHLAALLENGQKIPALVKRLLILGGEAAGCGWVNALRDSTGPTIVNHYGPTEATVGMLTLRLDPETPVPSLTTLPLETPLQGTRAFVTGHDLILQPTGIPGELCIGGVGLARQYLNRPDLTAAAFVPDPFLSVGGRLYKTGDRVRLIGDSPEMGQYIEYLGRFDSQIKIRGFRVEIPEIEAHLSHHPEVAKCAVVVSRRHEEPQLIGFFVPATEKVDARGLFAWLRQRLPSYMIPARLLRLGDLPLAPNGKPDRGRLQAMALPAEKQAPEGRDLPENPLQAALASIWRRVLDRDDFGVEDSFFDLGGHSLLATRVVSRIRQELARELPLNTIFNRPTIKALAEYLETEAEDTRSPLPPIAALGATETVPLSHAQRRLWFLDQLEGPATTYSMPHAMRFKGPLHVEALQGSIDEIVARHQVLRTYFPAMDGTPYQVPEKGATPGLGFYDLSGLGDPAALEEAERFLTRDRAWPFFLAVGPLLRVYLLRLGRDDHILYFNMHHMVSDGWSRAIIIGELSALYPAFIDSNPSPLPPLPVQYADFAAWQNRVLGDSLLARQLAFWKNHLQGAPPLLSLPTDRPRPVAQTFRGRVIGFSIDTETTAALRALCRKCQTTMFMTLQTGFALLLARYSGQNDIVVGTPIANRNRKEIEPLVGFFANTLAMRFQVEGRRSPSELLDRARRTAIEAFSNQDIPFEAVVESLHPERNLSHSPVFQAVFLLQNPTGGRAGLPGLTPVAMETTHDIAKFDLTLSVVVHPQGLAANWEFNRDLFDGASIRRMAGDWVHLLAGMAGEPEAPVNRIAIESQARKHLLLHEWQHTPAAQGHGNVVDRFEAMAGGRPHAVAISYTERPDGRGVAVTGHVTYACLRARMARTAMGLARLGVGRDQPIGLLMAGTQETVTILLGILRSGCAYLPLDPGLPKKRLAFMLADASPALVVSAGNGGLPEGPAPFHIATPETLLCGTPNGRAANHRIRADGLAYVIYTSGSTGRPKGAMVPHRGLLNLAREQIERFQVGERSRVLQFASLGFDASVSELLMALLAGAQFHLPPSGAVLAGDTLAFLLQRQAITHVTLPPSVAATLPPEIGTRLRTLILAGEACSPELAAFHAKRGRVVNAYGPTEATVCLTVSPFPSGSKALSLGRPIGGVGLFVLDRKLVPVPLGVAGELCAGGAGLARGYLRRPGLTSERFVPHPFTHRPGARLYRTGDLVRHLAEGDIDFLGRIDQQIKLRGYRVEPGEIEAVLGRHPEVREAVVLYRSDPSGRDGLTAWLVPVPATELARNRGEPKRLHRAIASFCGDFLPDHMHPSAIYLLDDFPRTATGKVDRNALRRMPLSNTDQARRSTGSLRKSPISRPEEALVAIWRQVFQMETVGANDHFFELGGHSLLATRVISQIRRSLDVALPLRVLFESPTPASLAARIESLRREAQDPELPPLTATGSEESQPLSFAQRRMWFIHHWEGQDQVYHIPIIRGIRGHLSVHFLERCFTRILDRHDILRTHFPVIDGDPVQARESMAAWPLPVVDGSGLAASAFAGEVDRIVRETVAARFDMSRGPMWRMMLLRTDAKSHTLALVIHHIIFDGWSADILIRELAACYEAMVSGGEPELPELPVQYADFSKWQHGWLVGERLRARLAFWKTHLANAPALIDLPLDKPRPAAKTFRGATASFTVPDGLAAKLGVLCREAGVTRFTLLNAAFAVLLARYSGQDHVVTGSPAAGRDRWEIEPVIGFFVNTLALHIDLSANPAFSSLMKRVHDDMLEALANQDLPFEKLVEELKPDRGLSYTPIFQVLFTLQNIERRSRSLPGLTLEPLEGRGGGSRFDLALFMVEGQGLGGIFEYSTDLFRATTIRRMAAHFVQLLGALVTDPARPTATQAFLDRHERESILREINRTDRAYPDRSCIDGLFEDQVRKDPGAEAILAFSTAAGTESIGEGASLTYLEINRSADLLAAVLRSRGVGPESVVALCLDRSPKTIVALLAILKAGGAYLPIDPDLPCQRRDELLADADAALILTDGEHRDPVQGQERPFLDLDEPTGEPASFPTPILGRHALNLAYVIYTSGSTGKPKGVQATHRAVVRLVSSQKYMALGPRTSLLHMAPLAFDASTLEIWAPLLSGGRCVLYPEKVPSIPLLDRLLGHCRIDTLWLTASLFNLIVEERVEMLAGVGQLLAGGEALSVTHVRRAMQALPNTQLINGYGPTEGTTFTCCLPIRAEDLELASIPIGPPLANTRLEVLDRRGAPVPRGLPGELLIGGPGLARAYLGNPAATAASFIPDGWSGRCGKRLYRSGDRVRLLEGGDIEFLGRLDRQVKISGFRIEPGEIEAALNTHPRVGQAVALIRETPLDGKHLACYVVSRSGRSPVPSSANETDELATELLGYLRTRLPAYMVPTALTVLDRFPLTANGKLDIDRLPRVWREKKGKVGSLPQNRLQRQIAEVWQEVLGLPDVDIEENFFELGGQSLLLIKVHAKLKQKLALDFPLVTLFQYTTIESLAARLGTGTTEAPALASETRAKTRSLRQGGLQRRKQRIRGKRRVGNE